MSGPFDQVSYLAQVRRLRHMAAKAISMYPIRVRSINFIHHGENTTFRIDSKDGERFLLRIHRQGYHSKEAILEEIHWLDHLSQSGLVTVPKPKPTKTGNFVATVTHSEIPTPRNCTLFEWIDGRFIGQSVRPLHLYKVGKILAQLQTHTPASKIQHRRYWTANGLVGLEPTFGSIDKLSGVLPKQQAILTLVRKFIHKNLRQFETDFPNRQGLIHADLHFGNLLSVGEKIGAIDFDDCGFGFNAYDLVVPLLSVEAILGEKHQDRLPEYKEAMLAGYTSKKQWDQRDEEAFSDLITARKLAMLGWLNSRSDNPRLKKHLSGAVEKTLKHINSNYDLK